MSYQRAFSLQGVTKEFPGVRALDKASLDVEVGEVHGLVGENGAGKSTVVKVLAGVYQPDAGLVTIGGETLSPITPDTVHAAGVRFVHQELHLVPHFTVAESVFLGQERSGRLGLNTKAMREETEAFLHVQRLLPDSAQKFKNLLWNHVSTLCYFKINRDGTRTLIDYGIGLPRTIRVILSESDAPMHHREIIRAIKHRLGLNLTPLQVCPAANSGSFSLGKGVYGLAKHIPFSDAQIADICREAESIVYANKTKKQWHCFEILSKFPKQADQSYDKLDIHLLNIVLSKSKRLTSLHRMVWTATESYSKGEKRVNRAQAIIAIIKEAGHPLTLSEIKERLHKVAGINKILFIPKHPSLVRVAPSSWDVKDKDVLNR